MNLITGAAGHLGNVLTRELLKRGEKVRALVLPGEKLVSLEGLDVEIIEGNILNPEVLLKACEGVRHVYHMAALVGITQDSIELMRRVNIQGTANVIEAARLSGVERLIYTSSIHAFERPEHGTVIDESIPFDTNNPAGPYDQTKAEASVLVMDAAKKGLDTVTVCPTGVIGPFDFSRSEMGGMFLDWMKKQPSISMEGHFDFVDVRDVALGQIAVAEKGRSGEVYLLPGHHDISGLRRLVQQVMGFTTTEIKFSAKFATLLAPIAEVFYKVSKTRPRFTKYAVETLQSNSQVSHEKAERELGYQARSMAETVKDTVEWWMINLHRTKATLRTTSLGAKRSADF
jgi:dihydroflavonol-4-reductase